MKRSTNMTGTSLSVQLGSDFEQIRVDLQGASDVIIGLPDSLQVANRKLLRGECPFDQMTLKIINCRLFDVNALTWGHWEQVRAVGRALVGEFERIRVL